MYRVDEATCTGCGDCVDACPAGAMALVNGRAHLDQAVRADCGSCANACPQGAIAMVSALNPAYAAIQPRENLAAVAPLAASVKAESLTHRPEVEMLSAAQPRSIWRRSFWPALGSALVWASRELLPEVIAAWRASRAVILPSASYRPTTFGLAAPVHRRTGHRHRWGRT
jgi:Fe-S-cluster-containing hydrogenase component 2